MTQKPSLSERKSDHLKLAEKAQTKASDVDRRFQYEPMLSAHPQDVIGEVERRFGMNWLGKTMKAPLWISSMTGGTGDARHINQRLAAVAGEFGLGMGLGSCRSLLDDSKDFEDFNLRPILGPDTLFMANIGVAQVEQLLERGEAERLDELVRRLDADALIVHVNPLQEWFQPEGDRLKRPALETIEELLEEFEAPVVVKEVGQGMGPKSLAALIRLPLAGLEFGAFGGTNFSVLESLRSSGQKNSSFVELTRVGHTAEQMVESVNIILEELGTQALCQNFIISGGIQSALHAYALMQQLQGPCVFGRARAFLERADQSEQALREFVMEELGCLAMGACFLDVEETRL
ncbi:MAG: hypothetical protein WEB87_07260 [Bacteriovoracaceae bacterium]